MILVSLGTLYDLLVLIGSAVWILGLARGGEVGAGAAGLALAALTFLVAFACILGSNVARVSLRAGLPIAELVTLGLTSLSGDLQSSFGPPLVLLFVLFGFHFMLRSLVR